MNYYLYYLVMGSVFFIGILSLVVLIIENDDWKQINKIVKEKYPEDYKKYTMPIFNHPYISSSRIDFYSKTLPNDPEIQRRVKRHKSLSTMRYVLMVVILVPLIIYLIMK